VVSIKKQKIQRGGGLGSGDRRDQLSYYQAVAARFDGIGGNRVSVNYDPLLSAYACANATCRDDAGLPRVANNSAVTKSQRPSVKT
jgi:hypothetical protein